MHVLAGGPSNVGCFSVLRWPVKTIKTDIFEVLIWIWSVSLMDSVRETFSMIFVLIHLMYYCEWGLFYAPARWWPCQCRLFLSWSAKIIKTNIFDVVLWLLDERLFSRFLKGNILKKLPHPIVISYKPWNGLGSFVFQSLAAYPGLPRTGKDWSRTCKAKKEDWLGTWQVL